jgi:hypothetical protein
MPDSDERIAYLEEFRDRDKFSVSAWDSRGLGASESYISESLHIGFRNTAELLISAVSANATKRKLRSILLMGLRDCKKLSLDTEEKEYASELFYELSEIVGVDIKHQLNIFLYGYLLVGLIYIVRLIKPKRKLKIIHEQCESCNAFFTFELDLKTVRPNESWVICQCLLCRHYFLIAHQESSQRLTYKNCMPVEYLAKDEFTQNQAENRLEQIRYFRK